jgi:hypothetical protein
MLGIVTGADVVKLDPILRYPKMTIHVEPPHNSPAFPMQGRLPRTPSAAKEHRQGLTGWLTGSVNCRRRPSCDGVSAGAYEAFSSGQPIAMVC